jgi:flagellar capping protein FliD
LSFDTEGHLNFDPTALTHATGAQFDDLVSFLGNADSGGFLQFATNLMTGVEDPTTGSLKTAISSTSDQISHENDLISTQQDQINQLQTSLQTQMAAADAAIAQIEQQLSFYTGLFQSMYLPNPSQFGG